MKIISKFINQVYLIVRKPQMSVLPGQLAFFLVLSIIPLIALTGTIVAILSVSNAEFMNLIESIFPADIASFIMPIFESNTNVRSLIVFFVSAFILASNGLYSMNIVANNIYNVHTKSYLGRRMKSVGLTFILILIIIFLLVIPAFGDSIFNMITSLIGQNRIVDSAYLVFQIIKYPFSLLFVYINLRIIYIMAPDKKISRKSTRVGALFTTVCWIVITYGYSIWINNFSNYTELYGYVANMIVLMLWIYILAYVFTIGLALNAKVDKDHKEEENENN